MSIEKLKTKIKSSWFYDKYTKLNKKKFSLVAGFNKKMRLQIGTAFMYEKIADTEIWVGAYPVLHAKDEKLGSYDVVYYKNNYIFLDQVKPEDWIPVRDKNIKKICEVIKFGEDDFRIRNRLHGNFFERKKVPKTQQIDIEIDNPNYDPNDPDSDEKVIVQKEEILYDQKTKEPILENQDIHLSEPRAVSEEGRTAIRKGNEYEERMREKRRLDPGFWSKWGDKIIMGAGILAICLTLILTIRTYTDAIENVGDKIEKTGKSIQGSGLIDVNKLAKGIVDETEKKNIESQAPPR